MNKIGFICEGKTEYKLLSSESFKQLLASKNLTWVNAIDAKGCANLLPNNIKQYIESLELDGAEKIFVITDLDNDACVTLTKQRVGARPQDIVIIAVKQIEAWFLACTDTMCKLLNDNEFIFDLPESEINPFQKIRQLKFQKTGSGITDNASGKVKLISILLSLGLDISQAATHPNCPSASYFINKLNNLN